MNLRFWASRHYFGKLIEMRAVHENGDGSIVRMMPAQFYHHPSSEVGTTVTDVAPAFSLTPESAQTIVDELWLLGIRPSEGAGSAGQLAATQAHLKDMQRLVFEEPRVRVETRLQ
jgi:hypothetical protein